MASDKVNWTGINLLKQMELVESDVEEDREDNGEEDMQLLPENIIMPIQQELGIDEGEEDENSEKTDIIPQAWPYELDREQEAFMPNNAKDVDKKASQPEMMKRARKCYTQSHKWGPVIPEKKSTRHMADGTTMMQKAQDLKMRRNLDSTIVWQVAWLAAGLALTSHACDAQQLGATMSSSPSATVQGIDRHAGSGGIKTGEALSDWELMEGLELHLDEKLRMWPVPLDGYKRNWLELRNQNNASYDRRVVYLGLAGMLCVVSAY